MVSTFPNFDRKKSKRDASGSWNSCGSCRVENVSPATGSFLFGPFFRDHFCINRILELRICSSEFYPPEGSHHLRHLLQKVAIPSTLFLLLLNQKNARGLGHRIVHKTQTLKIDQLGNGFQIHQPWSLGTSTFNPRNGRKIPKMFHLF